MCHYKGTYFVIRSQICTFPSISPLSKTSSLRAKQYEFLLSPSRVLCIWPSDVKTRIVVSSRLTAIYFSERHNAMTTAVSESLYRACLEAGIAEDDFGGMLDGVQSISIVAWK